MFTIPSGIFQTYFDACDELINNANIGVDCELVYPPKRETCSCQGFYGQSGSSYRSGGIGTSFGSCTLCDNKGFKEVSQTESIRLRCYWTKKEWRKIVPSIQFPDADVMIIGYLTDLSKLNNADEIRMISNLKTDYQIWKFSLAGECFPWGFGKSRYFVGYLKRV